MHERFSIKTFPSSWPWCVLFPLAFFLRAWHIDLVHFEIDEAIAAAVSSQIGHLRRFPLTGIETSYGFHNPPLLLYLFAPVFALAKDPRAALLVIALLGSLALVPMRRAGELLAGRRAGWIAALLLAVCPAAVEHSRRLWGADLMVLCGTLSLWAAFEARKRRSWKFLASSFAAAAAGQAFHLSGLLLWLPGVSILVAVPFRHRGRAVAAGALVLGVIYLPWIANEFQTGFEETRIIFAHLSGATVRRDLGIPVPPLGAWAMVLGDLWHNDLLGAARPWMVSAPAKVFSALASILALGLLAGGLIATSFESAKGTGNHCLRIVLLAVLLPALVFGVLLTASVPPYFLPALPPAILAASVFLQKLDRPRFRPVLLAILAVYTIASAGLTLSVRHALSRGAGPNLSLREKMAIITEIEAVTPEDARISVMQNARNPQTGVDVAYAYLLYWRGLNEQVVDNPAQAEMTFVIVHRRARLLPPPALFLRHRPARIAFPHSDLYRLSSRETNEWLEILRRFPAPTYQ